MPRQEITWTVCPNGLTADGRRLRLSIFVAPRLSGDFGETTLAEFPDFTDWPARLPEIVFSLSVPHVDGEPALPLTVVSPPAESALWRALLPTTTPVLTYQPDQHVDRPVCTYAVPDVIEALQTAYLDTAEASIVEPPLNVTPQLRIPVGQQPEPEVPSGPGLDELFSDFAVQAVLPELPDLLSRARSEGVTRSLADTGRISGAEPPKSMLEVMPPARTRADQVARAVAFAATTAAHAPTATPRMDFHERLTALGEHPVLLRRLGLVIDAEVDLAAAALPPEVTTLRVQAAWRPLLPAKELDPLVFVQTTFEQRPRTAVVPETGQAARRDGGEPGVLPLPEEEFLLEELDVDGAVQKATNMVAALSANSADRVGPPALRTAGLALVRVGHAHAVHAIFTRLAAMGKEPLLYAEDLTRGYRMDVRDLGLDGQWRSLHQRSVTYDIDDYPQPIIDADDEGMFALSMRTGSADADSEVYLHENLIVWNGWSLSAPRPETPLPMDTPAPQPTDAQRLRLTVRPTVAPGSLPRLRFGHSYQVRLRTVDLAGNGPGLSDGPDAATASRAYLRFEPVGPPVFAPDEANVAGGEAAFGPGETVHRLVVRNYLDGTIEPARRVVVAPRGSTHLAQLHGRLDDSIGATRSPVHRADGLAVVSRDGETLTYPVGPTPPYLPDPLASGVSFRGLPTTMAVPTEVRFDTPTWHEPHTFTLHCGGPTGQGPVYDAATHTLNAPINPGDVAEVRASSLLTEPDLMALLRWARETRQGPLLAQLEAAVRASGHCMFTPWQAVTLVHAVIRPLSPPDFTAAPHIGRGFNDTGVDLVFDAWVDAKSTGTVSLIAQWRAQVDDLTQPAWQWREQHGTVFTHTLPDGWVARAQQDLHSGSHRLHLATGTTLPTHQLGETRHRQISYHLVGMTKFGDYFDPETAAERGGLTLDGAPAVCEILNSAPAPAPVILGAVPALLWRDDDHGPASVRVRHGGIRVYLQRPWFATGDGELLGVVLGGPGFDEVDDAVHERRASLVSRIGLDPIRIAGITGLLRPGQFRNAVTTLDVELAELRRLSDGGPTTVTVAGFTPEFDERSGRWFCDIDLDTGTAYMPFVRLVVARFQPASLRGVSLPDDPAASPDMCVISPITTLDPIMTLPDRRLDVVVRDDATVDVVLVGAAYNAIRGRGEARSDAAARSRVWARWAARPVGSAGAWTFTDQITHEVIRDDAAGQWRLLGLPSQATSATHDYRLLIAEVERTPADVGDGFADRVVFAEAVDVPVG